MFVKESDTFHNASEASQASCTKRGPPSTPTQSLKSFGFQDPVHGTSEPNQRLNRSQPSSKNMLTIKPKPIVSVEDFFNDDMPLSGHSIEESPCQPIIDPRPGEISTGTSGPQI